MARDTGALTPTLAAALYADPSRTFTLSAATSASNVITYTATVGSADLRKILSVGSAVVITGFTEAGYNFDDGNNSGINTVGNIASTAKTRAVVASVPSASTFTVVSPVTISDATASGTGTLYQDSAVSGQPLDNAASLTKNGTWLSPTANANARIAVEWGPQMARIQPNFADGVGGSDTNRSGTTKAITAAVANGTQINFTSTSHSLSQGQYIEVTGITNPAGQSVHQVNTRYVISAVSTDNIYVNSTYTGPLLAANAAAVVLTPINGTVNATTATFSTTAATIAYTTATPHGYVAGQVINVSGAANENYNVKNAVITTNTSTTLTIQSQISPVTAVSVSATTTYATYTVAGVHNFAAGDKVWVKNITANNTHTATNSAEISIISVTPTSFTVATGASGITITSGDTITIGTGASYGQAFKGVNGSFSGTARVGQADGSWGQSWLIPSGTLITGQDNNELALTSPAPSGFPDYTPAYTAPYVLGSLQTPENPQAVRAFDAAGFSNTVASYTVAGITATNGNGTMITAASGDGTSWTYTAAAHTLVAGQIVNISNLGAFNAKNAVITSATTNSFTIANTSSPTALSGLTAAAGNLGAWFAYNTLPASAVTIAATAAGSVATVTTSVNHGLKVGDVIGIGGTTSVTGFRFAYLPTSAGTSYAAGTLTPGTTVASVISPTQFTYLTPATASSTTLSLTNGFVHAFNGTVTAQSLSAGSTSTNKALVVTVSAVPSASTNAGGTVQNNYA